MTDNDDLIEEIHDNIKTADGHQGEWRKQAEEDFNFYAGRQYSDDEVAELKDALRPDITFNRIGPVVDAVHGHHLNDEQDIRFVPQESGDEHSNEILTQAAKWFDEQSESKDDVGDAFLDLIICGMGWCEEVMDYDEDPDGMAVTDHIPPMEMLWDSNAKKKNLKDARWLCRRRWWKRREAEEKWPEIKHIDFNDMSPVDPGESEEPIDAQNSWRYENSIGGDYNRRRDEVLIHQYQYYTMRAIYRVQDQDRIVELDPKRFDRIKDSLDMMGIRYVKQMKKVYREVFFIGDEILEENEKKEFTLLCMTGKRDANKRWWFGLIRGMKDPQKWSNKFFAEIQDYMASNRRGGAFAEQDAFIDPRAAETQWNEHNALIMLNTGGIGKIQERQAASYPHGLDRLMELAISAIPDTSGVNLEMMGMVDRNQPGILESQRKRAAMAILADLFRSLESFQKKRGRILLRYIQDFMSDGRLIRLTGKGKAQYVPLVKQVDQKFDVIVSQAPHSPNQKEENFGVMMQLLPLAAQLGYPPPPDFLTYAPLPKSFLEGWLQHLQNQQPKPDPMQQAMVQEEIKNKSADTQQKSASAMEKQARAQKIQMETGLKPQELQNDQEQAKIQNLINLSK